MNKTKLSQLLARLQHQLNILKEREAKAGGNAPLDLLNQINDHEQAIKLVRASLAGKLSAKELKARIEPLWLSLERGRTEITSGDKVEGDKSFVKVVFEGIPNWLLFLLLAAGVVITFTMVIAIAYFAWLYFVPDQMPLNTFNVAVAEFGQVDAQGNVSPSEDGQKLSEWIFLALQDEYKSWPTGQPTVWHDSQGIVGKRAKIGLIPGNTPAERSAAAKEVAERIGANMVIYGNLAIDENPVGFRPEFYVAAISNEADEIVGQYELGSPIGFQLPINLYNDRARSNIESSLGVRVDALVWFTQGLAHDLSGRHEDALETFREAETELKSWKNDEGKEILYYFIGRQALFLSDKDLYPDIDLEPEELLVQAEKAFSDSLKINPHYTRAHIGLGGVYFQRAQSLLQSEQPFQTKDLDLAITHYSQAVENARQAEDTQTEIKGRLGLGISYKLQGDAYLRAEEYDQADPFFDLAIKELQTTLAMLMLGQDQHLLLAQAYLGLGGAYEGKAYITRYIKQNEAESKPFYEDAHTAYEHCIEHADEEFYDSFLQELKAVYCGPYSQEVQEILDSL